MELHGPHQLETVWRQVAAWCWHRRVACRHAGYRPGANIGTAMKIRKVFASNIFSGAIPFHRILKIGVWLQVPKETMPCLEKINQLNSQLRFSQFLALPTQHLCNVCQFQGQVVNLRNLEPSYCCANLTHQTWHLKWSKIENDDSDSMDARTK